MNTSPLHGESLKKTDKLREQDVLPRKHPDPDLSTTRHRRFSTGSHILLAPLGCGQESALSCQGREWGGVFHRPDQGRVDELGVLAEQV